MKQVSKEDFSRAHDCLHRAERCFLDELHSSARSRLAIIKGLDKLELALEYVHNWDHEIPVCCRCGGIYSRKLPSGSLQCLDCDFTWEYSSVTENSSCCWQDDSEGGEECSPSNSMREALRILEEAEETNLQRSSKLIRESLGSLQRGIRPIN